MAKPVNVPLIKDLFQESQLIFYFLRFCEKGFGFLLLSRKCILFLAEFVPAELVPAGIEFCFVLEILLIAVRLDFGCAV